MPHAPTPPPCLPTPQPHAPTPQPPTPLQSAGEGVSEARRQLLRAAVDSRSDHIALVAAYNAWCRATDKGEG